MQKVITVIRDNRFLIGLIIVVVGGFLLTTSFVKKIETDSMSPTMPRGTVFVVIPTDHVQKGDVITFQDNAKGNVVTHRVYAVEADGTILTKGDANDFVDGNSPLGPLQIDRVKGAVLFNQGISWVTLIVWAVMLLVVSLIGYMLFKVINKKDDVVVEDQKVEDSILNI